MEWIRTHIEAATLPQEGEYLYLLARRCSGKGVIVEIGSLLGSSTCFLALGSKHGVGATVYVIDPFDGGDSQPSTDLVRNIVEQGSFLSQFLDNIRNAQVQQYVTPIVKRSVDAVDDITEPIELLFIDGAHGYSYVLSDYLLYSPKVVDGGHIIFHDRTTEGVAQVITEHIIDNSQYVSSTFQSLLCAIKQPEPCDVNR